MSTGGQDSNATDIEDLSVEDLIKWTQKQVPYCTSEHIDIDDSSQPDTKRVHVQEGSGKTTDTQRSLKRKAQDLAKSIEVAQRKAPRLLALAELCKQRREDTLHHFQSNFKGWEDAKVKLSSPNVSMDIPFPFSGSTIPKRFKTRGEDEACYHYMEREVFSELVDAFKGTTRDRSLKDLWIYGLMGYGKPYLLATLLYFLTAQGYRVVYLPDCRIAEIINLRKMDDVEEFLLQNWDASVILAIDQMDALEDPDQFQFKAQAEMDAWWDCHSNVDLGEYSRTQVEDLTGKIPLLLDSYTVKVVVRQSQRFASRMKGNLRDADWAAYQVTACITGSAVLEDIHPEHVDHRFFYEKDGLGYCACGIVRETVTKRLAQLGTDLFSIADSIREMTQLISNVPVVGYSLELAILQTIRSTGISWLDLVGSMPQIVFDAHPKYVLEHTYALYVPKAFNSPAIDALILRLDHSKMKAELIPIKITIAKSHSTSEDLFFKDWSRWLEYLEDYDANLTFLWITASGEYLTKKFEARYRERREGPKMLVRPAYSSVNIPLKEVNAEVWRKYWNAKIKPPLELSG
ncbi:hypothetical protein AJ80_07500 [Polytolypa hystricis UAMH7299]|uniref:Uncharacterized protein n=1 Tax=Polytolypa hystricis (strain UAMH7299) TaxID=1447883 RepID=A0A2B7XFS3_POLH7|nr:hypothetical protein AJ80_07500 [Polytolypa hystricis UAMH7299]